MSNLQSLLVVVLTVAAIFVPQFIALHLSETRTSEAA